MNRLQPLSRFPRRGALVARLLAALSVIGLALPAPAVAQSPRTAVSAGPATFFPDISADFEDATITSYVVDPLWPVWDWTGQAGIAANGSGLGNPGAPRGTHVAFVQDNGIAQVKANRNAGLWRVRLQAAQRITAAGPDQQRLRISMDGVEVAEIQPTATFQSYTTRPIHFATTGPLLIRIEGLSASGAQMACIDAVQLEPIADWLDVATWGGAQPPTTLDTVTIPAGVAVGLRALARAATITCVGELLACNASIDLATQQLMVRGRTARFEVGRKDTPFVGTFTLTLEGSPPPPPNDPHGTKYLIAMNAGTIEMHGTPVVSWTRLAATANVNATQLSVAEPVTWNSGDEIVLASSSPVSGAPPFVDTTETATVASVGSGGFTITLQAPIAHRHFGGAPTPYTNGTRSWTVDQRCEVGVLTHNVRIQGDASSTGTGFGGHVMVMHCPQCVNGPGVGRFSNVEFTRMGQKGQLGRYPMHWHMATTFGAGQYIENCSVHRTYNRAITIHGTDGVRVERNVAYDHLGHGIFFEDGSEQDNQILHNLVLSTKPPAATDALLQSDHLFAQMQNQSPAAFWITNPTNTFIGNVAAGTTGTGYWFALPDLPMGLSATPAYAAYVAGRTPRFQALGAFQGNVCHSSHNGFDANDGLIANSGGPNVDDLRTNVGWLPPGTSNAIFEDFVAYACHQGIYTGAGGDRLVFRRAILCDNERAVVFASYNTIEDSLIVADTGNRMASVYPAAYVAYDGAGRMVNCHADGFDSGYDSFVENLGGASRNVNHTFSGMTFNPAAPPRMWAPPYPLASDPSPWSMVLRDKDGSIAGHPGYSIVTTHPMMTSSLDIPFPNWFDMVLSPYRFVHLTLDQPDGVPLDTYTLTRVHPVEPTIQFFDNYPTAHFRQVAAICNGGFEYDVDYSQLPASPSYVLATSSDAEPGDVVLLRFGLIGQFPGVQVFHGRTANPVQSFGSLSALQNATSTGYFHDTVSAGKPIWVRIVNTGPKNSVRLAW